jgi:hypothetical protein
MGFKRRCDRVGEWICRATLCGIGLLGLLVAGAHSASACYDFGDAGGSGYPTLRADDGARHRVRDYLRLGAKIDVDDHAQPTANADGDDLDGADDEDGILFLSPVVAGRQAEIKVQAEIKDSVFDVVFLNAWIDFNGDQDWDDDSEHIFLDQQLQQGSNSLFFDVPASAVPDQTLARFRLNSRGGLTTTGFADDGEVEDYAVTIHPVPEPSVLTLVALGLAGLTGILRR